MIRPILILIFGCFMFWAILAYPAFRLWATRGLIESSVAASLCLLPSLLILIWEALASGTRPQDYLWLTMGGTGIRMGMVLGLGLLIGVLNPNFQQPSFLAWVLVFYLFTLALDIVVLLKVKPRISAR